MWTIVFAVTTVVWAVGWLTAKVSLYAILWYLEQKNVPAPSDEEMERGTRWAAANLARDLLHRNKRS